MSDSDSDGDIPIHDLKAKWQYNENRAAGMDFPLLSCSTCYDATKGMQQGIDKNFGGCCMLLL